MTAHGVTIMPQEAYVYSYYDHGSETHYTVGPFSTYDKALEHCAANTHAWDDFTISPLNHPSTDPSDFISLSY